MVPSRNAQKRPAWTGVAFVVEAVLLLVFLIGALALFTKLFASSIERGDESRALTTAVAIASDTAERFAADPDSVPQTAEEDGMIVICDVTDDERIAGMYRKALITVYDAKAQQVYSLETAVYESGTSR